MMGPAEAAVIGAIVGALASAVFIEWRLTREQDARKKSHWAALSAEIDMCYEYACELLTADKAAPLYRLPTKAFDQAFPALMADGAVSYEEVKHVSRFYNQVEQINRGLDLTQIAADALQFSTQRSEKMSAVKKIQDEADRNRMKAARLVLYTTEHHSNGALKRKHALYEKTRQIIDQHITT